MVECIVSSDPLTADLNSKTMVAAVTPPPPLDCARNINRAETSEEKRDVNSTGKATVACGSNSSSCVSMVKSGEPME